jgi:CMP-N-acetylneuraminic acid synthetase
MLEGRRILAVVPARAGSKGVANKNMRPLAGLSLIGWAARALRTLEYMDARIISTDAQEYASEGARHGLEVPFLRPAHLSDDRATAVDTVTHALLTMEQRAGETFAAIVILEPTSPLRLPDDVTRTLMHVIRGGRDSAVTLSRLDAKWHPRKALRVTGGTVTPLVDGEPPITSRQELDDLFWRNGVCYAVSRDCLIRDRLIIGRDCGAEVIEHAVVNIDAEWEFDWAEFLLGRPGNERLRALGAG